MKPIAILFGSLALLVSLPFAGHAAPQNTVLSSPDGNLTVNLHVASGGALTYGLKFKGQTVLEASALGITVDDRDLGQNAILGDATLRTAREMYPMRGGHRRALNHYREAVVPISGSKGATPWKLEIRAFDDGIAYRYRVPGTGQRRITGESSQWHLPSGATIWFQDTKKRDYESPYQTAALDALSQTEPLMAPTTIQLPGVGYAMVTEANLINYSDMDLLPAGVNRLQARFPHDLGGWTQQGEIVSPWRVTLFSPDLNGLANSDIVRNLCPPPAPELANASWIVPGRATWHWMTTRGPKLAAQRQWVDWTRQIGFEYYLIDDGWARWTAEGKDQWVLMKEVVDYARTQGVGIWAWVRTTEVTAPADRLAYFKKAKETGIVGLKIDFMGPPNAEWVQWYDDTLCDAAAAQLMINFHGAVKPTGRERTWPHELTREAIRGRENSKLPGLHDTTLPFLRFVQGHADYTPTEYDATKLKGGSWARELAQAIVYTSPMLCLSGSPELYLQNPSLDIIQALPATWDETLVLPGSAIGERAAFARRKGNEWFIGVVNGREAKSFAIDLKFLNEGAYRIDKLADNPERNDAWNRTQTSVSRADQFSVELRAEGGFVARLRPLEP